MNLKNGIYKILVTTMVMAYILSPIREPFFNELHRFTHFVEFGFSAISTFFSMHHHDEQHLLVGHEHGFIQHGPHEEQPQTQLNEDHEHGFLSFFSSVLGALEDQHPADEAFVPGILEKHLMPPEYTTELCALIFSQKETWYVCFRKYVKMTFIFKPPPLLTST